MPSNGIDRFTGKPLAALAHVRQSVTVLFSTVIGTRVMRRFYGARVPDLLGRNLVPSTLMQFFMAIVTAIDLWEPRLRVVQIQYPAPPNAPSTMKIGHLTMAVLVDYRPNALQGDVTTDVTRLYL